MRTLAPEVWHLAVQRSSPNLLQSVSVAKAALLLNDDFVGGGVLLFQRQVVIFTVFLQLGQFVQATMQGALVATTISCMPRQMAKRNAPSNARGSAPGASRRGSASGSSPFHHKLRLHWGLPGSKCVEARQQFRQHFRLCQRVRQGDRQAAGSDNGIQVLFLQGLCEVPV